MGYYINHTENGKHIGHSYTEKYNSLTKIMGATIIHEPIQWSEGIICLVDNGAFAACGYCYSPGELEYFKNSFKGADKRKHTWFHLSNAKELAK